MGARAPRARSQDPQFVAGIASLIAAALGLLVAWLAQTQINILFGTVGLEPLQPISLLTAWGTANAAVAVLVSLTDLVVPAIVMRKGSDNRTWLTTLLGAEGHRWFALFSWSVALVLFVFGIL